ncbi:MAG: low molecular weight protein-tyrosine-phosphatase [Gammaproteobacteria bacterium]|jgi:protein-tyrosine phosphatase
MKTIKVLFVCMGNICRSPTAHGILQKLVEEEGLAEQIIVDSAGTISYHAGEAPDRRSAQTAMSHGIDINYQRSRQITPADYEEQDYILAMDFDNLRHLQQECPPEWQSKLYLLLKFHPDEFLDEVPDPYYGGESGFEMVYQMVDIACRQLLKHLKQQLTT